MKMLNLGKLSKIIKQRPWIFVILGYLFISLIFHYQQFWSELFFDRSSIGAVHGEVQAFEWTIEKFYQTLLSGNNPFGFSKSMLYPFDVNLGLFDSGHGLFFPMLKPFFSTHQAMSILVILSIMMTNIGMYFLLRKLKFKKTLSFLIGASFGYMTFLIPRGGHISYWFHFVFPWFYLFCSHLADDKSKKMIPLIGASIFFVLALWFNLYYFVILLISVLSLASYFLFFNKKVFFQQLKKLWKYLIAGSLLVLIFLLPWLKGFYELMLFDQAPVTQGWGGAIQFSSDLFNYFLPSAYTYIFTKFPILLQPSNLLLNLYRPDARLIFENFTYPGITILLAYISYLFLFRKKSFKKINVKLKPFLFTSLIFVILTLGPFLHVFGHWRLSVDDGIKIVIPLPYILLHYVPFIKNIRVPGRLIVGFIFFAYIVTAYIIRYLLVKKSKVFKIIFFAFLFIVLIADSKCSDVEPPIYPRKKNLSKIFNTIRKDDEFSSVLEVPFTVRDGFTYLGNGNAFQMIIGESVHGKPFLGGYLGRIADYKKAYYQNNPFLGYIVRIIDDNVLENPRIDKDDLINWQEIDLVQSIKTIDFLDIKYILNNNELPQSASLSAIYQNLGYAPKLTDHNHSLWVRALDHTEFKNIQVANLQDYIFLGFGWYPPEDNWRYTARRASIMFKLKKPKKYKLNFQGAAWHKNQAVTIYLNKKKVAKVNVNTTMKEYSIPINTDFSEGINTIYFVFDDYHRPIDIIPGSLDERRISGQFTKIWLEEQK